MPDPEISPGATSILVNAIADGGMVVVPITLGSLAPLDPLVTQLLVAGYIQPTRQDDPALPADRIAYSVTEKGRKAAEKPG